MLYHTKMSEQGQTHVSLGISLVHIGLKAFPITLSKILQVVNCRLSQKTISCQDLEILNYLLLATYTRSDTMKPKQL